MIKLSVPLHEIRGIGPRMVDRLKNLNIETVKDLLWHFPFRYEDFSKISKIKDVEINQLAVVQAVISDIKTIRTWKKRMLVTEALISDNTSSIGAVWFNQPYIAQTLKKGILANFAGKVMVKKNKLYFSNPSYEVIRTQIDTDKKRIYTDTDMRHTGRIVPIYSETRGLTSRGLRFLIKPILDNLEKLPEILPKEVLSQQRFLEINEAIRYIHFPENLEQVDIARKRFAFEDLFLLQLNNLKQRLKLAREQSYAFKIDLNELKSVIGRLPFELTLSQKKSLWEILKDLEKPHPMNRFLQGDVGSGKTIVAGLAALMVASNDCQTAFMAPTEVLAKQHYHTLKSFFPNFTKGIGLITSGELNIFYGDTLENEITKKQFLQKTVDGKIKIIIGTHSLIQKNVAFKNLALAVVDEQHRFGIEQRAQLLKNRGDGALLSHFLSMSATPIPRTLSLTIFGDLDLSMITELPKGRKEIITKIVSPANRQKAYEFIRVQIQKGRQAFVICPRIDPAEVQTDVASNIFNPYKSAWLWEAKAVKEEYEKLSKEIFPDLKVGMLHGKLKAKEKTETMKQFNNGIINILVSTSVVEVGIDVPNATIMMIEGSERFGLAQLYQFRGRVGRGEHQSFCFLLTESSSKTTRARLHSLIDAKNGFELAEKDLAIRGPGQILGAEQTGMPDLAMKAIQNPELIKITREAAAGIIKTDPEFNHHPALKNRMEIFQKEVHLE